MCGWFFPLKRDEQGLLHVWIVDDSKKPPISFRQLFYQCLTTEYIIPVRVAKLAGSEIQQFHCRTPNPLTNQYTARHLFSQFCALAAFVGREDPLADAVALRRDLQQFIL